MKKTLFPILVLFCIYLTGCCSLPRTTPYQQLHSFTKKVEKSKSMINRTKVTSIRDFREREAFDQDINALKEKVEQYISCRSDLNEATKNNLRELKVTGGSSKEDVELLLGEPDKIIKNRKKDNLTYEAWIYKTNKRSIFTVIFLPLFFGHEKYSLYFQDNALALIERHYLEQTFSASDSGMGLRGERSK